MQKLNFLIIAGDPLLRSLYAGAIREKAPGSTFFNAGATAQAMDRLVQMSQVALEKEGTREETCILLDRQMPYFEAYVFLHELYQVKLPFAIRLYLLIDPDEPGEVSPDISKYQGINYLEVNSPSAILSRVVDDHAYRYFQHAPEAKFPS